MSKSHTIYDSPRLAYGYAFHRPPLHPKIIQTAQTLFQLNTHFDRALDLGCGAGISTNALNSSSGITIGLEPIPGMLSFCHTVAPASKFLSGRAEHLPFAFQSFDLITAAGVLNYADLTLVLPEVARVLRSDGVFLIYDFSNGRRMRGNVALEDWYHTFKQRYPSIPGYAQDMRRLQFQSFGLRLKAYQALELELPMTLNAYLNYILSGTNVERAITDGVLETEIRAWCQSTLAPIFQSPSCTILFEAYIAQVIHDQKPD